MAKQCGGGRGEGGMEIYIELPYIATQEILRALHHLCRILEAVDWTDDPR